MKTIRLYERNLKGHWDAMNLNPNHNVNDDDSGLTDHHNKFNQWSDLRGNCHLKAPTYQSRPHFNSTAINGLPALRFIGSYLVSDVKYPRSINKAFTWIMAVKPQGKRRDGNIFSTSDIEKWGDRNSSSHAPFYATRDGFYGFYGFVDHQGHELSRRLAVGN